MKAIILAAGEGKRLRPLTDNIPKCLIPINGKPLLEYWMDNCERAGVDEILVNGHYLADKVEKYLETIRGKYSLRIHYVYEPELVGTGGTIRDNYHFIKDEVFFFFCHGDNFTNINIADFVAFHKSKNSLLSVALFETNVPKQCGIAEKIARDGRILKFTEKPENPKSNLASAAIFLMSPEVIKDFPDKKEIDFSKEVLPKYQGRMFGYKIKGFNIDIGTLENYKLANEIAEKSANSFLRS